ncbi:hypothetical protein JCM1840_002257 [Sporobolomyces johnsonii]
MDPELSIVLRQGTALKGSGLHQDELATLADTTSTTVYPSTIEYDMFNNEARTEWAKIAARRRSNAAQLKALGKKAATLSISSPSTRTSSSSSSRPNANSSNSSSGNLTLTAGGRPPKLTELERDWLSANHGCFKCCKIQVDHKAATCNQWAPANWVVRVAARWDRTKPVPTPATTGPATPTPGLAGVCAVYVLDDDEIDLPESLADDSDDSDECTFPPLPIRIGSTRRNRSVIALADSGSSIVLISDKLVKELELVRVKLSRPKRCRVAIKGQEDRYSNIDSFVRAPLSLENGSWSAGNTIFLVAPIEDPFDVILGGPFIKRHCLLLGLYPVPRLLAIRDEGEPLDLLAPVFGPPTLAQAAKEATDGERDRLISEVAGAYLVQLEDKVRKEQTETREMEERAQRVMDDFDDLFPSTLPPLTPEYLAKTTTRHRIRLIDDQLIHNQRGFSIPRKWREAWKRMLNEQLKAGRLRPSTSPYASAAFVVPKKDPTADSRWVNDYQCLNANMVKDRTPLPLGALPDLVLADATLAKFWGKIGMTNTFFQTPMDPDDIAKTAIKTPWGLFEWTVMPQDFLGHIISGEGIEADPSKIEKIKSWTRLTTVAQYIAAEKNYPPHEQELLAIIAALKVWRIDLLGVQFKILTDHDTLKHFQTQPTLSKRQARWMEVLADYDFELLYGPGKENTVADSLSRFSFSNEASTVAVCGISEVSISKEVVQRIMGGYKTDLFDEQVQRNLSSSAEFSEKDGLLFFEGSHLVVPKDAGLWEALLHDAHDVLGHLGPKKTLAALSLSFFWPRMSHDVLAYVSSCDGCQRHKSRTTKRAGQLRTLPVPEKAFTDVRLDFIGPLPISDGKDMLLVITGRLTGYARLLPCRVKDGAKEITELVWRGWFCLFGLPKCLMSPAFHPETDGRSQQSNKTAIQVLRQFVAQHQKDWVSFLATTEYAMNTAVNNSTGKTPFELVLGHTPSVLPSPSPSSPLPAVELVVLDREDKIKEAREALAVAKVRQAEQANRRRGDVTLELGNEALNEAGKVWFKADGLARQRAPPVRHDGQGADGGEAGATSDATSTSEADEREDKGDAGASPPRQDAPQVDDRQPGNGQENPQQRTGAVPEGFNLRDVVFPQGGGARNANAGANRPGLPRPGAQAGARAGGARMRTVDLFDEQQERACQRPHHDAEPEYSDDDGEGEGEYPGDEQPPLDLAPYEELVRHALDEQGDSDDDDTELPADIKAYRANILQRSIDFHDKQLKRSLLVSWRMVAARHLVAVEDIQRIALGEYISFPELRDSWQGSTLDLSEETAAVYHVQQSLKKAMPALLDPLEWDVVFHKWSAIVDAVNYGLPYEDLCNRRFRKYRKYILGELRRDTSVVHRHRVLNYEEAVRSSVPSPVSKAPIKHFGDCATHDLLYYKHVLAPVKRATPASSRSGGSTYCWKYNHQQPHIDCGRLHACYNCGDAEHLLLKCPELGREGQTQGQRQPPLPRRASTRPRRRIACQGKESLPDYCAPPSVLSDSALSSLLSSRPELFSCVSPLSANAFDLALANHPNRHFVESLVEFIRDGFWLAHDGSVASPPPPRLARSARYYATRPEDQLVLVENTRKSEAAGLISPAFDDLPEGCVISPQFVVWREGSAPRVVDGHSASGLNEGIKDAPAMYDHIDELVRILRCYGILDGSLPESVTLYKLDVAAAFKLLLMHPRWQARQAILVPYVDEQGLLRPCYHLQWRAVFGSRASPFLWTHLMAAVGWVVWERAEAVVPFPLFYMDDGFGIDLSHETRPIEHDGKERRIPRAQAETLEVWDELGLKWRWKKALFGRRLTITGIVVDLDHGTLTLKDDAVERFAVAVAGFIDRSVSRQRPLREWRQIVGWANWALTVRPWARPLLSPVYAKLGRSSSPYTGLFLNNVVVAALELLVADLCFDLMVHTDVCLEETGGTGSGLGFHFADQGQPLHYVARPLVRYSSIQLAEGLAVFSALDLVVRKYPQVQRLLVRTNSAPIVYAFETGGSREPLISDLVRLAYELLRPARVDRPLRRLLPCLSPTLRSSQEGAHPMSAEVDAQTVRFASRVITKGKAHSPAPSWNQVLAGGNVLWKGSIAKSTTVAYERAYRSWLSFTITYSLPFFPLPHTLSAFVTYRAPAVVPSTLAGELFGITYYYKAIDAEWWEKARSSPEVGHALLGNVKLNPHVVKKAAPLPVDELVQGISDALALPSSYDDLLWAAMASVAFLSRCRAQEVLEYDNPLFRNFNKHTAKASVRVSASGFSATLPYHKADPLYMGSKLYFSATNAGGLLSVVRVYLAARDARFADSHALWLAETGTTPTRRWFVALAKSRCGVEFSGHSFRAGGASFYARWGVSEEEIKRLGRWKPDAWRDYVRLQQLSRTSPSRCSIAELASSACPHPPSQSRFEHTSASCSGDEVDICQSV